MPHRFSPGTAWAQLTDGNDRFRAGRADHPHQSVQTRERLAEGQDPFAAIFGCSDSRVSAEIVFDRGLGDLFVVRTAGHVVDPGVLGSLEFAVGPLGIPLIVVMAHTSCGAIRATLDAVASREVPTGFLRDIVERIAPSVLTEGRFDDATADEVGRAHLRHIVRLIVERSSLIRHRIDEGSLAVVGLDYDLSTGQVDVVTVLGDLQR